MNSFLSIIKKHKLALWSAVFIGLVMAAPHWYFIFENQDAYQGIMMGGLDEGFYLSRIQEARDGYLTIASPFWLEYKNQPYLWPPLPENLASWLGQIFGLNLISTVLFENFLFPFFIFLLIYGLVYKITQKKYLALIGSLVISLTPNLTDPQALSRLLLLGQTEDTFLAYSRLISPQIHVLFFFLFFLLFWFFWEKRRRLIGISSGIVFGLSFYVYPFLWVFIGAFLFWLALGCLLKKDFAFFKSIIIVLFVGFLIGLPFFWNLILAFQNPFYQETSLRFGWVESHAPKLGITMLVLLGIFLLFFPKENKKRYDFLLAFILAPFLMLNQQMITGYLMAPARWHHYYYKPIAIVICLIILFSAIDKLVAGNILKKYVKALSVFILLAISFYNAYLVQAISYQAHKPAALENQRYADVLKWLDKNAQKDQVAMADFFVSDLITVYTSLNAAVNLDNHYSLSSDKELIERMFIYYRFEGLEPKNASDVFLKDRTEISKMIYAQRYQKQYGQYQKIPDANLLSMAESYQDFYDLPLRDLLKKYQVQYLVWDKIRKPYWQIGSFDFFEFEYESNNIGVYRIKY